MERKAFPVEIKSASDEGTFTALASVFNNIDLGGDKILPGAFQKTLEVWRGKGNPIPIVLSHKHDDVMAIIGEADPNEVQETEQGLEVNGSLDLENPVAVQTHKLMKKGLLTGWSFAYSVPKGGQEVKDGVNEVKEVGLYEAGPTLIGMNPQAQLQAVKSMEDELETELAKEEEEKPEPKSRTGADELKDEFDEILLSMTRSS